MITNPPSAMSRARCRDLFTTKGRHVAPPEDHAYPLALHRAPKHSAGVSS